MSRELQDYVARHPRAELKLHLGCGGTRWKDFVNVDLFPASADVPDSSRNGCVADVFADIRALGLPDDRVDEIFSSHTVEHFPRWVALQMLRDWHRMLKPGGRLVVEMPDFWRCVAWLFHPRPSRRALARTQFYGNQWDELDFETHRYLWSGSEFRAALREIGFRDVQISHRTQTHYPGRDLRATGIK